MIVVDCNVVAYCWINGPLTPIAQRIRIADADWHMPVLWRSELCSALFGYCRAGHLTWKQAGDVFSAAERAIERREHVVPGDAVLRVGAASALSAYDSEYVALARALGVPLVTEDAAIRAAFPDLARSMEKFLE